MSPPLGVYVHVPFCATRCGYCDFVTYTAAELPGVSRGSWVRTAVAEVHLAAAALVAAGALRPVATVFVGGGTPTLLPPAHLGAVIDAIADGFGLRPGAEITVEANPETVDAGLLEGLLAAGVNRLSIGMQSAADHVLATLDRTHTPGRAVQSARAARAAGFTRVSLDLIYGTPGETDDDWRRTLDAALEAGTGHVSAYALIVEPGTRLAAQVRRGELPPPDDDVLARRYELADTALEAAGLPWYEIASWGDPCRHNLGYWSGGEWWGVGPGAHSYLAGERRWNERHPSRWAAAVAAGRPPVAGAERPDADAAHLERVMLAVRLRSGIALDRLRPGGRERSAELEADGLLERGAGRLVLTRRGRLLADHVTLALAA